MFFFCRNSGPGKVRGEIGFLFLGHFLSSSFSLLMLEELFPSMVKEHQCHTTNEFGENPMIQKNCFRQMRQNCLLASFTVTNKIYLRSYYWNMYLGLKVKVVEDIKRRREDIYVICRLGGPCREFKS